MSTKNPLAVELNRQNTALYNRAIAKSLRLNVSSPIPGADLAYRVVKTEFGPITRRTILAWDLRRVVSYDWVDPNKRFHPDLPFGPAYVGEVNAHHNPEASVGSLECLQDYYSLVESITQAGMARGKLWHVGWSYVCFDDDQPKPLHCDASYRDKKVGSALYHALVPAISEPRKVALLVADECVGSATSPLARRVYPSLLRKYVGAGLVVTPISRASDPGKILLLAGEQVKEQQQTMLARRANTTVVRRRRK